MESCDKKPRCKEFADRMGSFRERLADHDLLVEKVLEWWEEHRWAYTYYDRQELEESPVFVEIAKRIRRVER